MVPCPVSRVPCSRERELGGPYHLGGGPGIRSPDSYIYIYLFIYAFIYLFLFIHMYIYNYIYSSLLYSSDILGISNLLLNSHMLAASCNVSLRTIPVGTTRFKGVPVQPRATGWHMVRQRWVRSWPPQLFYGLRCFHYEHVFIDHML